MQPSVLFGIGVRFVPSVDDRSLEGRLQADFLLEEISSLRDLEQHVGASILAAHLAGAGDDLAGYEEGGERRDDVAEGNRPWHEIVLVGPVRIALPVTVVLVDPEDLSGPKHFLSGGGRPSEDHLSGLVEQRRLERIRAFRRGVLGMRMVHVQSSPVGENHVDHTGVVVAGSSALEAVSAGVATG